jgi:hypothetical protein
VIKAEFDRAEPFSEGLAAVAVGGRLGFISRDGRMSVEPQYAEASSFTEGLALVRDKRGFGYIKSNGDFATDGRYLFGGSFRHGLAPVRTEAGWGIVDHRGQALVAPEYDATLPLGTGRIAAMKGGKYFVGSLEQTGNVAFKMSAIPNLVSVRFESTPPGAAIYKPSLWDYEHAADINDLLTPAFRVARDTPTTHALDKYEEYRIILVFGTKTPEIRRCVPTVDNPVEVNFPP